MSETMTRDEHEAELRILRARAQKLAVAPNDETKKKATLEVVRFRLGENIYAIEAQFVFATRWLHELTPVPGTPAAFLGITPHQGGVLPVVALDVLFGHDASGVRDLHRVLVVGASQPEIGRAAGKEIEVAWIDKDELFAGLDYGDGACGRIVAGVTQDGLTLLDGRALLEDERMFHGSPRPQEAPRAAADGGE